MNEILFKHLLNDYQDAVRDPLWGNINVNPLLRKLMETRDFAKLTSIRQLGPTLHIYPGATHTRYNHSLGVYHIAKKLLLRVVQHESCPELTIRGVKSFLNAALLHDLGHFPYTHSLKELPLMDHETLSAKIILDGPLGKIIDQDRDNSSVMTAAIIDQGQESAAFGKELLFYRHLLSGVLDPDKLDYLNRDAFFCGVPYGIQDTDFILSQIIPVQEGLAISEKGTLAVENILFSKYLMYRAVYWHRDVRISTALVKKSLFLALSRGELQGSDLYGLTDYDFSTKIKSLSPDLVSLIESSEHPHSYLCVLEKDYDDKNKLHERLQSLEERIEFESLLADNLQKAGIPFTREEVIIDIPEKISFEVNLPVRTGGEYRPFTSTETLFSKGAVENLTGVLRKVRLFLPREKAESKLEKIVKITQIQL